jgi:hypothetical protein
MDMADANTAPNSVPVVQVLIVFRAPVLCNIQTVSDSAAAEKCLSLFDNIG